MKIEISGIRIPITEDIDSFVKKKVKKFNKYFKRITKCHVVLKSERKGFFEVEINLFAKGLTINGKEETNDLYAAIEGAIDKVSRQSKKFKEKKISRKSAWHRRKPGSEVETLSNEGDKKPRIVNITRELAKPMSVDEARMQLEVSDDNFLVFLNGETNQVNVIYKMDNDHFGLIQPE